MLLEFRPSSTFTRDEALLEWKCHNGISYRALEDDFLLDFVQGPPNALNSLTMASAVLQRVYRKIVCDVRRYLLLVKLHTGPEN